MSDVTAPPPVPAPPALPVESTSSPDGPVDAAGFVIGQVPCRLCGTILRGVSVMAPCPGCGAPVGDSVPVPLRYSDPAWVTNLGRGVSWMFWGNLLNLAAGVVGDVLKAVFGPWARPLVCLVGAAVFLRGAWVLTEPEPGAVGQDRYRQSRRMARMGLAMHVAGYVIEIISLTATLGHEWTVRVTHGALMAGLVAVAGHFATLRYLESLCLRLPDPRLSRTAGMLYWGYGVTLLGAWLLLPIVKALRAARGGRDVIVHAVGATGCGFAVAQYVFSVWYLVLLRRLRSSFSQQADAARQTRHGPSEA